MGEAPKSFIESAVRGDRTESDRKTGAVRALLAPADSDGLNYAGAAFIALRGDERSAFFDQLEQLKTSWRSSRHQGSWMFNGASPRSS